LLRKEKIARSNAAKQHVGSERDHKKVQSDNNPQPHIPPHELSSEQKPLGTAAHQKPLTAGEVSEALMPESEVVKRHVVGLVASLVRALWHLRTAKTQEAVRRIFIEVRDGEGCN
jgi:hypothetical protein